RRAGVAVGFTFLRSPSAFGRSRRTWLFRLQVHDRKRGGRSRNKPPHSGSDRAADGRNRRKARTNRAKSQSNTGRFRAQREEGGAVKSGRQRRARRTPIYVSRFPSARFAAATPRKSAGRPRHFSEGCGNPTGLGQSPAGHCRQSPGLASRGGPPCGRKRAGRTNANAVAAERG